MIKDKNVFYDLPALLKKSDLQIRKVAATDPPPTVGYYFSALSGFLDIESDVSGSLSRFSGMKAKIEDCKSIDMLIKLLEAIGCEKYILESHSLLDAYGKIGNWREASVIAKHIKEGYDGLCKQIKTSQLSERPAVLTDADISLSDYIVLLEEEEENRKLTILAIDDSPPILQSISAMLSDEYKVYTLSKPESLSKVLEKLTPDLFLLDYRMPEISGFELVPIIRSMKEHEDTPIIFLTSESTIDNVTAALALGACDFAVKPFKLDMLREKIARHIVRKKVF